MRQDVVHHRRRKLFRGNARQARMRPVEGPIKVRLFPKTAERRSVVAARCANGETRVFVHAVVRRIRNIPVAGPAFNAQRHDVEFLEHGRHARRHGAKVFGANEHIRFVGEYRQKFHGILFPECVLSLFILANQVMQFILFVLRERKEHRLVVPVPVRVERIFVTRRDKYAVPVNTEHGILDFLRFVKRKNCAFRQVFRFDDKAVELSRQVFEIQRNKSVRFSAEEFAQLVHRVVRTAQIFKCFTVESRIAEHFPRERDRRLEATQNARRFLFGNRPNTEEPEHVVNAVRVIELACLRQTAAPPAKVIGFKHVPAVSREAPVLATVAEHVRRSARAVSKREVLAVKPHVGAVFVDEDRNIALEAESELRNFVHGSGKLTFGSVLHPGLEQHVPVVFHPELIDIGSGGILELFPVLPASFVVLGLERAIDAVRLDPGILVNPGKELL